MLTLRRPFLRALAIAFGLSLVAIVAVASPPGQAAPVVSGLSPWVVSPGQEITISGDHFAVDNISGCSSPASPPQVAFLDPANPGSQLATVTPAADAAHCANQMLKVTVPPAVTSAARVQVINVSGGQSTASNNNLEITVQPPPAGLSPGASGVGTTITVSGGNLGPATLADNPNYRVLLNGSSIGFARQGSGFVFGTPHQSGAVSLSFQVRTDANNGSANLQTITVAAGSYTFLPPSLSGGNLSPATVGTRITLPGSNLGSSGSVTFTGGVPGQAVSWSQGQVQATVPARAQSGPISVSVATDGYGPVQNFDNGQPSVVLLPLVNSVSPGVATAGASVRIGGYNFGGRGAVTIGGASEAITSWSDTLAVFSLSNDTDSGVVTLTRADGQSAQGATLIVTPRLTKLETTSGPPGIPVVVDGLSLGAAQGKLTVGGQSVAPQLWSRETVLFVIPALKPGTYPVVVTSAGGQVSNSLSLVVTATPASPVAQSAVGSTAPSFDNNHDFHKPAKPASPVDLNVTTSPQSVPAGGTADVVVTLKLNGKPVSGAPIKLSMIFSPGTDYAFTPDSGTTDGNGEFKASVRISKTPGNNIVLAQSGVFSDQDQVIGTGKALSGGGAGSSASSSGGSGRNPADWGNFLPLIAMGALAAALVAGGLFINLRSHGGA